MRHFTHTRVLLAALAATGALAAGCDSKSDDPTIAVIRVEVQSPDPAPSSASVTADLSYEAIVDKRARLDRSSATATAIVDPALLAALDPAPFARIAHVSDVQIREERGFLLGERATELAGRIGASYIPAEGLKRKALQEANSPFVWLGVVLTLNEIHAQRPIDVAIHSGDMVDIGLASELDHFIYASRRLTMPFLAAAGNHDILGFGMFKRGRPTFGARLDEDVSVRTAALATFTANQDYLVMDRPTQAATFRDISIAQGPHAPTQLRFGSLHSGFDIAKRADDLYYSAVVKLPTATAPGLQVVVLETSRDDGEIRAQMDDAQAAFLNDTLDAPDARANIIVVIGHHPLFEVHRRSDGLGERESTRNATALQRIIEILDHYPNVAMYLCGHTHLPEVVERRDPVTGALGLVQVDAGSILIDPQQGTMIDMILPGDGTVVMRMNRFGANIADGSDLARHVAEGRTAAASDDDSRPRYAIPASQASVKVLPAFPVTVPKFGAQ